jgi:hypothetical protein
MKMPAPFLSPPDGGGWQRIDEADAGEAGMVSLAPTPIRIALAPVAMVVVLNQANGSN